jgi:hypothetical protein
VDEACGDGVSVGEKIDILKI